MKRKLAAILSAGAEGYSRLMGEDEPGPSTPSRPIFRRMGSLVEKHQGRVVAIHGDNLLAEFASVVDAVQCAVEIQKELKGRNEELPKESRMPFRIGINLGDVIEEEGNDLRRRRQRRGPVGGSGGPGRHLHLPERP